MSRAFVKEQDDEFVEEWPDRPISPYPNDVTETGLALIEQALEKARAEVAAAQEAGIPVLAYGAFVNEVVNFIIVGFAVFLLIRQANRFKAPPAVTTKPCPKCTTAMPLAASRCPACCADL